MDENLYFTQQKDICKRKQLKELFNQWIKQISTCDDIQFPDDGKKYPTTEYFVKDGFYPGYFSGKYPKVLFIGRETRGTASFHKSKDRILCDLEYTFKNSPNKIPFVRRIFYIYYGILTKGKYQFCDIPYPVEMVKNEQYGFAFMNISKYSNDSERSVAANYNLINQFFTDSDLTKRNFIREEIELLDPDIIITANLWDTKIKQEYLELVFPTKDFVEVKSYKNEAILYDFQFNQKKIKFIDAYHFSAIGSDGENFYEPIINLLFK